MCRYINGNLNVRFSSCLNAQFDICIKGMCKVLQNYKTAALIIEINLGAATQGILKYWLGWWQKINASLIRLWLTDYKWWCCFVHLHITLWQAQAYYSIPVTDRQTTLTVFVWQLIKSSEKSRNLVDKTEYQPKKQCVLHPASHIFLSEEQG